MVHDTTLVSGSNGELTSMELPFPPTQGCGRGSCYGLCTFCKLINNSFTNLSSSDYLFLIISFSCIEVF